MNSPVVTPAFNLDAGRTNAGRSRIGIFGMILVDVVDVVADNLTARRAGIAIDADVYSCSPDSGADSPHSFDDRARYY